MAAESSAAASMTGGRKIVMLSSDGHEFEVSEAAASLSVTLRDRLDAIGDDDRIKLPNQAGLAAKPVAKVVEYCNRHVAAISTSDGNGDANDDHEPNSFSSAAAAEEEDLKSFDAQFIDVDQAMLYDLIMAASYLEIEGLLDLCSKRVGDMIKGKTPDQIRGIFGIKNDFTADEEAEIRRENPWFFGNE